MNAAMECGGYLIVCNKGSEWHSPYIKMVVALKRWHSKMVLCRYFV